MNRKSPSKFGRDSEILQRSFLRKIEEKASESGVLHAFWGLWEQDFDAFCASDKVMKLRRRGLDNVVSYWYTAF